MKTVIAILAASLFLGGCFYQTVDFNDIRRGELFCKERGGVYKIESFSMGEVYIKCMNGEKINVERIRG